MKGITLDIPTIIEEAKAKKAKKKNPPDATLRNINALKKRVAMLETKIKLLIQIVKDNQLEVKE